MDSRIIGEIANFVMMILALIFIMTIGFFMYQLSQLDSYQHAVNGVIERSGNITPLAYARLNYIAKNDFSSGGGPDKNGKGNTLMANGNGVFGPPIPTGGSEYTYKGATYPKNGGYGIHYNPSGESNYKTFNLPKSLIADSPDDYTATDLPLNDKSNTLPDYDSLKQFQLPTTSYDAHMSPHDLLLGGGIIGNSSRDYMAYPTRPRDYGQRVGYVIPVRFHIGIPGALSMYLKLKPVYQYGEATSQIRPIYHEHESVPQQQSSGQPESPKAANKGSNAAAKKNNGFAKIAKTYSDTRIHYYEEKIADSLDDYRKNGNGTTSDIWKQEHYFQIQEYIGYISGSISQQNISFPGSGYTYDQPVDHYINIPDYGDWHSVTSEFPFLSDMNPDNNQSIN